jgi:hypothetical protein
MQPAWAFICQIATKTCTFFLSLRRWGRAFVGFRVLAPPKIGRFTLGSTAKIEISIGSLKIGNHSRKPGLTGCVLLPLP